MNLAVSFSTLFYGKTVKNSRFLFAYAQIQALGCGFSSNRIIFCP
jgi:hypothetical protein